MSTIDIGSHGHTRIRARETRESNAMFFVTFPMFLAAGVVTRAVAWGGASPRKPLIAEARSQANTCIPFAFMR